MTKMKGITVMPGYVIVLPEKEDNAVAGFETGKTLRNLPRGEVVGAGVAPAAMYKWWEQPLRAFGYLPFGVRRGDRIIYSRVSASDINVVHNGAEVKGLCVKWIDVRAKIEV